MDELCMGGWGGVEYKLLGKRGGNIFAVTWLTGHDVESKSFFTDIPAEPAYQKKDGVEPLEIIVQRMIFS